MAFLSFLSDLDTDTFAKDFLSMIIRQWFNSFQMSSKFLQTINYILLASSGSKFNVSEGYNFLVLKEAKLKMANLLGK